MAPFNYKRPKHQGGQLIRQTLKFLRNAGETLPYSKVVLAVSGGADSMALLHLIANYGQKIVDPKNILVVHIDHNWRNDGYLDHELINKYCLENDLKYQKHTLKKLEEKDLKNKSPENEARVMRKEIFEKYKKEGYKVLTAHHGDDLAETLLWKLCSGKMQGQEKGILINHEETIRPFLHCHKENLISFLNEEGIKWNNDSTNFEGKLLRSKMRTQLLPMLEEIFPEFSENIKNYALEGQIKKT